MIISRKSVVFVKARPIITNVKKLGPMIVI